MHALTKRGKRSRSEKQQDTLNALVNAAIKVIGKSGYAGASVSKITETAGVANGTFYNYFDSRQDLFDKLLPLMGDRLLLHIKAQVEGTSARGLEREVLRLAAYLDFLDTTPGFLRIFNEAEVFSPKAYRQHVTQYYDGYVRALRDSMTRGELDGFSEDDLDTLAFLLMGMRSYLGMMFQFANPKRLSVKNMISVYSRLISKGGLYTGPAK